MTLKMTIMGCGSSTGVPRVGGDWGKCDPTNPRNRRRRCALLIEKQQAGKTTTVLVDTGPDLREQLIATSTRSIDGVLYTHDHADHTHGIDDLRIIAYIMKRRINVWADATTKASLTSRFAYCFTTPEGSTYPPILTMHDARHGQAIDVSGPGGTVTALPIRQFHGDFESFGFRIGDVAYSPDVSGLSEESAAMLGGLDLWIVDALRATPHPSHFSVGQALEWIGKLKPKRAILTHLHIDLDYETLQAQLPPGVEVAYDGMVVGA